MTPKMFLWKVYTIYKPLVRLTRKKKREKSQIPRIDTGDTKTMSPSNIKRIILYTILWEILEEQNYSARKHVSVDYKRAQGGFWEW